MIGKVTTAVCYTVLGITWFNLCLLGKEDLGLMLLSIIVILLIIRVQNPKKQVRRYARKTR